MQDRPTARELLDTIAELLEKEVLGAVSGPLKHQVRVAGNLCRILEREVELGSELDRRARELLLELLGDSDSADSAELAGRLAERLLADDPELERRAWRPLIEIVRGKLAIAKPGHDDYDFALERPE